jgi:hypothetical protein
MKYVNEAKKYHLLPARQQDICNKQTRHHLFLSASYLKRQFCIEPPPDTKISFLYVHDANSIPGVAVTGALYALGGYDNKLEDGCRMLSSIEMYDIREDEWSEVGQLPIAISSFSAAVVGESIYTFGGEKNDRKDTAFIQCFDTRMRQSCRLDAKIPMKWIL